MPSRASLLIVSLIAGAAASSQSLAAPHHRETPLKAAAGSVNDKPARIADAKPAPKEERKTAAASDPAKTPPALARKAKQAKAKQRPPLTAKAKATAAKVKTAPKGAPGAKTQKPDRTTTERERALDVAAYYAPKAIARLRRNRTIERAETSRRGTGWSTYVDTYARGR